MVLDPRNKHEVGMYFDLFAPELSSLILRTLRPGDTFLDCGANVGYFSFLAAPLVGEKGRVISVDPNPYCIDRIRESAYSGPSATRRR